MVLIFLWLICGVVSGMIASGKGHSGFLWFILGMLFGPFGIIFALLISENKGVLERSAVASGKMKKCPYCAELIRREAIKCRYCAEDVGGGDVSTISANVDEQFDAAFGEGASGEVEDQKTTPTEIVVYAISVIFIIGIVLAVVLGGV